MGFFFCYNEFAFKKLLKIFFYLEGDLFMSKIKIFSLGGLDENGKNTYVIEIDKSIFIFDCGLKYATGNMLGIDYIIPDYEYLIKNQKGICYAWTL